MVLLYQFRLFIIVTPPRQSDVKLSVKYILCFLGTNVELSNFQTIVILHVYCLVHANVNHGNPCDSWFPSRWFGAGLVRL